MAAILYTTSDAIRSAVGVTTKEVSDDLLTDQLLESQVRTAVYGWLPTHATIYAAGVAAGATEDEKYQKDLLVHYCLFYGAVRVIEMIMALRSKVSDGKSQLERFDVEWKDLLDAFKQRMEDAQEALLAVVSPDDGETAYFGIATPGYDPVTNS